VNLAERLGIPSHHEISLAVWDLPSPVVMGRRATLKAGISCPYGCSLAGTAIDILDAQGVSLGNGRVGTEPLRGTMALYWAEIEVVTPDVEGDCAWSVYATPIEPDHDALSGSIGVVASRPPEHRVTVEVKEHGSGRPLGDVELRLGRFRAATNDEGISHVEVPRGTYDVGTWKNGYRVVSRTIDVATDATIRLELIAEPDAEQPYWM
jgi:hypothetical protein